MPPPRIYPSIPHLPGSRAADDRTVSPAQARRCIGPIALGGRPASSAGPPRSAGEAREEVIVQEKLDGSCVAVARRDGALVALGREGRPCAESGNEARRWFAAWVAANAERFEPLVREGDALVGEWLALVHGTRYAAQLEPFVPFDVLCNNVRLGVDALAARLAGTGLVAAGVVHRGGPIAVADAARLLGAGLHRAIDPPEGLVYRVERAGRVLLVAKWVRPGKVDGAYLPERTGLPALYHWRPG